jgi:hypothetical protein
MVTRGGVSVSSSGPSGGWSRQSFVKIWETLRLFQKNFSEFFFLFSEIQYRKTKWDSGAFFPLPSPQLAMEVSDKARTWTNRLVGGPPPVLVGRVRVGLGQEGGLGDFQWAEWWLVEAVICQNLGNLTSFSEKFLGIFFFFLRNPIPKNQVGFRSVFPSCRPTTRD